MPDLITGGVTVTDMPPTAGTETPLGTQTPNVAGSGTPMGADEGSSSDAGAPQGGTDDGQQDAGQRRPWTKIDEIRELRQWRREARQRETAYQSELQGLRSQLEEIRRFQQPGPRGVGRTPADFWQDPEGALARNMDERLAGLEDRLLSGIQMSREQEAQQMALRGEQESAVEFIRSQPNYAPEDDEDLIDIIESIPAQTRAAASPAWVAEYAWLKLQQERGVSDRSTARQRASSAVGQPPGVGLSGKVWSQAEFDRTVDALAAQGHKADQKLLDELTTAVREGRVR